MQEVKAMTLHGQAMCIPTFSSSCPAKILHFLTTQSWSTLWVFYAVAMRYNIQTILHKSALVFTFLLSVTLLFVCFLLFDWCFIPHQATCLHDCVSTQVCAVDMLVPLEIFLCHFVLFFFFFFNCKQKVVGKDW